MSVYLHTHTRIFPSSFEWILAARFCAFHCLYRKINTGRSQHTGNDFLPPLGLTSFHSYFLVCCFCSRGISFWTKPSRAQQWMSRIAWEPEQLQWLVGNGTENPRNKRRCSTSHPMENEKMPEAWWFLLLSLMSLLFLWQNLKQS